MSRFFKTARPEFLQGVQYELPVDLMLKVIQNDNAVRNAIEQEATKTEYELLNTPHLQFDKEALKQIQASYKGDIDALSQSVYTDTDVIRKAKPKMKELNKRLLNDRLTGHIGAISGRYTSFAKFQEENKDVRDKDPGTYNMALAYELNKLQNATAKDPMASFSSYKVQSTPNFRKDVTDEIAKLKASKQTVPDGKGYLIKISELSPDRIMNLAVSNIMSRPEYREYSRQQTMYGVQGFYNPDGTAISPFTLVSPEGRMVTSEELEKMPDEAKKQLRRTINPNWRFGNEVAQLASAFAYREQDMDSDGTWVAKMREAGANARHAQSLAFDREKFQYQKQKDAAELELKMRELEGKGASAGGKGSDHYKNVMPANRYGNSLDGYQTHLDFSQDVADVSMGNSRVSSRLQALQGKILGNKVFQSFGIGNSNLGKVASQLINQGIDLKNANAEQYRETLRKTVRGLGRNGGISINGRWFKQNEEGVTNAAKYLAEEIKGRLPKIIDAQYKQYNDTSNMAQGYGLSQAMGSRILDQAFHSPEKVKVLDTETGQYLTQSQMRELLNNNKEVRFYNHPRANGRYGGVVTMNVLNNSGVATRANRYIIEGADVENRPSTYSQNELLKGIERELTHTHIENSPLADLVYGMQLAGKNSISNYDLSKVSPVLASAVNKIWFKNGKMEVHTKNHETIEIPIGTNPEIQLAELEVSLSQGMQ